MCFSALAVNRDDPLPLMITAGCGFSQTDALVLDRGAQVVATDIREDVDALAGGKVATLQADARDEYAARVTLALALERFGRIDVLVSNAGRTLNRQLVETSAADWDAILATNARGAFLHLREAGRIMAAQGSGVIVAVASVVSAVGMRETAPYSASKGAIAQLVKTAALDLGTSGVRVNAVAPGSGGDRDPGGHRCGQPRGAGQVRPPPCTWPGRRAR